MNPDEPEYGRILLSIGEGDFFVDCLLLLHPRDLKSCRLVSSTWSKFIEKEVWRSKRGKMRLQEKLVEQWKTAKPAPVELAHLEEKVFSLFCNDSHVFCGVQAGKVAVYDLTSGQWLRDLLPSKVENGLANTMVGGSKEIVAGCMWEAVFTVWSAKEEMEQLFCYKRVNFEPGMLDMRVDGSKVFIVGKLWARCLGLFVLKRGEHTWGIQTIDCFPDIEGNFRMTADKNWVALVEMYWGEEDNNKLMLWRDESHRQDFELPDAGVAEIIEAVALDLPFLVVLIHDSTFGCTVPYHTRVYQLAGDQRQKNLGSRVALLPGKFLRVRKKPVQPSQYFQNNPDFSGS